MKRKKGIAINGDTLLIIHKSRAGYTLIQVPFSMKLFRAFRNKIT